MASLQVWKVPHPLDKMHSLTVNGYREASRVPIPITLTIRIQETSTAIEWDVSVDVPFEGYWDDHPLMRCRAVQNGSESVSKVGERVPKTSAVLAMLKELCESDTANLAHTTLTTHKARLIASLELMWA